MKGIFGKVLTIRILLSVFIAIICLMGYSNAAETREIYGRAGLLLESVKQNYLASIRLEALKTKNNVPDRSEINSPASFWLKRARATEINMVTNRMTKELQGKVVMNEKVYYTPGESFALTLQQNPSLRFAKDPLTNKSVDKANAVIYADASGRALYFESDDTYKKFISLAEEESVFGYSKPKDSQ